ncbi:hypothetical protein [Ethanoligenens sp.]|uniref:hypothetical protein n=1 Tax=Ethanoligenens sp. TaxID=2099655 RepID=UPI0039EB66FB
MYFSETGPTSNQSSVKLPQNKSTLNHIFNDNSGHVIDTPGNRKALVDTANDPNNYLGKDKYGNNWYAKHQDDGTQIWVETRNGQIWDGGINNSLRSWNGQTGLKNNEG